MRTRVALVGVVALGALACGGGDPAGDALVADGVTVREVVAEGDAWRWAGTRGDRFCTGRVRPGAGLGPLRLPATFDDEVCDPVGGAADLAWTCAHRDDGATCRDAGLLLQRAGDAAALPLLERACELGEGAGCRLAGVARRDGTLGSPTDPSAAAAWLERGCNLSDDRSCAFRGQLSATAGDPHGCAGDGPKWFKRGGAASKAAWADLLAACPDGDPVRARALWAEACEGGDHGGCRSYGYALAEGTGGPVDLGASAEVFRRGCHAEPTDLQDCIEYGLALVATGHPDGGPRALAAFQRACDAGVAVGCRDVGLMLAEGQLGVHADGVAARVAFQKGCDGGDAPSCQRPGVVPPPN